MIKEAPADINFGAFYIDVKTFLRLFILKLKKRILFSTVPAATCFFDV